MTAPLAPSTATGSTTSGGSTPTKTTAAVTTAAGTTAELRGPKVMDRLGVLPWPLDTPNEHDHDPRSAYVETFWLPVLGPSTTLLMRHINERFEEEPEGFEVDCIVLSRDIGLGPKLTKRSSFVRTIERSIKFRLAELRGDLLFVRQRIPPLTPRHLSRLSPRHQTLHDQWNLDEDGDAVRRRTEMVRATHLARTLLALGEPTYEIEQQLHRWQFHPSIAWHAVQWAQTEDPKSL